MAFLLPPPYECWDIGVSTTPGWLSARAQTLGHVYTRQTLRQLSQSPSPWIYFFLHQLEVHPYYCFLLFIIDSLSPRDFPLDGYVTTHLFTHLLRVIFVSYYRAITN